MIKGKPVSRREIQKDSILAAIKGIIQPKYFYFKIKSVLAYIFTSDVASLVKKLFLLTEEIPEPVLKEAVRRSKTTCLLWGEKDIGLAPDGKGCEDKRVQEKGHIEEVIIRIKSLSADIISGLAHAGYLEGLQPEVVKVTCDRLALEINEAYNEFLDNKSFNVIAVKAPNKTYPFLAGSKNGIRCYICHFIETREIHISEPIYNNLKEQPNLLAAAIGGQTFQMFLWIFRYYQLTKDYLGVHNFEEFLRLYANPLKLHNRCKEKKIIFLSQIKEEELHFEYYFVEAARIFKTSLSSDLDRVISDLVSSPAKLINLPGVGSRKKDVLPLMEENPVMKN